MRTKFFHVIVLSCILALSPAVLFPVRPLEVCARENDENSTTSELYALSAVLMDADNGRILLQKNASEVLPMASTTKTVSYTHLDVYKRQSLFCRQHGGSQCGGA